MSLLGIEHFLENENQARQNQVFLSDESHRRSAMGEEERKTDEAAVVSRLQKMSYAKISTNKDFYYGKERR